MVKCKNCERERPDFCLGPDDCDKCRYEGIELDTSTPLTVADIQGEGRRLLSMSDHRIVKYVLEEPNSDKLELWKEWRQKVREKMRTCEDGDDMLFPLAPKERI